MSFADLLKQYLEQADLQSTELARRIGVTSNYLYDVLKGRNKPPTFERCQQIADALQLSPAHRRQLIEQAAIERTPTRFKEFVKAVYGPPKTEPPPGKTRQLYLLGRVPAGPIKPTDDYVMGMVTVDYSLVGNKDAFALKVQGDCLNAKGIVDGDTVIVVKGMQLQNGNIAVVRIHQDGTDQVTMKIWRDLGDQILLMPASTHGEQEPIVIRKQDEQPVEIIGKVIAAMKDFR